MSIYIRLENSHGCELETAKVEGETYAAIAKAVRLLIHGALLQPGDTIKIVED